MVKYFVVLGIAVTALIFCYDQTSVVAKNTDCVNCEGGTFVTKYEVIPTPTGVFGGSSGVSKSSYGSNGGSASYGSNGGSNGGSVSSYGSNGGTVRGTPVLDAMKGRRIERQTRVRSFLNSRSYGSTGS